ncbi:MAG: hypothetical protein ACK41C_07350 [Phenylobacterium sp.]|uniref:hypothetical protein n=1 Tax=Phenylobacterium sp. TaxID=1871053 RepID=UPI003918FB1E
MSEHFEETLGGESDGALVHWMARPAPRISTAALSSMIAGAFLVGAGIGLALAALSGRLTPEPERRSPVARWLH